ncbi:uncharacterized protein [Diadema setosum]|uniref:uncharacterized protein n=1 Tax=Diadema setosum TaxID=31175 RepID=UPI003B3A1B0A
MPRSVLRKKGQKKRRGFSGIPSYVKKKDAEKREEEPAQLAQTPPSARKVHLPDTSPTHRDRCQSLDGYTLLESEQLCSAFAAMHTCPDGEPGDIVLTHDESQRAGLALVITVSCGRCEKTTTFHSSPTCDGKVSDINRRSVLGAAEVGLGREGLTTLTTILGTSAPISARAFDEHMTRLKDGTTMACEEQQSEAVQELREAIMEEDPTLTEDSVIDVSVSFDGTWHKRGYTSNVGVGVVISIDTGKVLDSVVKCKYCKECSRREGVDRDSVEYKEWWEGHKDSCTLNHKGSSNSMECEAAGILWGRSISKHKLRYRYMIGDGDSKAYNMVKDTYGEGHKVMKLECIGHIGKRMYKALDNIRKEHSGKKLEDGVAVGRKASRLTGGENGTVGRLSKYYRNAIYDNRDPGAIHSVEGREKGVEKMQKAVMAVLYHSVKQDDDSARHQYCPDGDQSWCEYKRNGSMEDKAHHLDGVFLNLLLPTFKRLSAEDLLLKCLPGHTQNQNESFNALIWQRCPKHQWRGPRAVQIAVNLASLAFNCGARESRYRVFDKLNLKVSTHVISSALAKDRKRVQRAEYEAGVVAKKKREALRKHRARVEEEHLEREGETYGAGAF